MSTRREWWIVWLVAVLPLLGWWLTGLFDLDEGFYGAVTAEMNRRGEWVTPFFNGKPWFEKPILLYWIAKPCLMLFGDVFGPRLPGVLATFATYALVAWFCKRRFAPPVAPWAVLILASSLLFAGIGRMMMTDSLLILCLTGALLTFWESLVGDRRWRILSAALVGFGVHAKGPVAIILFLLIVGWTYYRERDLRPKFSGNWLFGILTLAGVVALWYVPAYLVNGQAFVQGFLVEQNLNRFTGGDEAHTVKNPLNYLLFVPILFAGMLPWSIYIYKAWPKKADPSPDATLRRYLATWAGVVFLFFTISGAKLPHYILPCFVPLAILVADYIVRKRGSEEPLRIRNLAWPVAWTAFIAIVINGVFLFYYSLSHQEVHRLTQYVRAHRQPGDEVAVYRMPRQEADKGTGTLKLRETSHPSILLYLNDTAVDSKQFPILLQNPHPLWILTRANRIKPEDIVAATAAGKKIEKVETPIEQQDYALWKLTNIGQ